MAFRYSHSSIAVMCCSSYNVVVSNGIICGWHWNRTVLILMKFVNPNCLYDPTIMSFWAQQNFVKVTTFSLDMELHAWPKNKTYLIVNCEVYDVVTHSTWWRHQMETFSALLDICAGNSPVTGKFPHKGQWRGALMFSLICAWMNERVNNRGAGDFTRHCVHCDATVMKDTWMPRSAPSDIMHTEN